jgi:hypothetical protein
MALAEARKDGRPGSLKPGRSLSVVAGARNHLYRTKVTALSRRLQGFKSPSGRQLNQ